MDWGKNETMIEGKEEMRVKRLFKLYHTRENEEEKMKLIPK